MPALFMQRQHFMQANAKVKQSPDDWNKALVMIGGRK